MRRLARFSRRLAVPIALFAASQVCWAADQAEAAPPSSGRGDGRPAGSDSGPAEPGFEDKPAVAITLKGGAYTVAEERQPMDGSTALLDTKAISPIGLEVEWRQPTGFAAGGEVFYFRNKWTDSGLGLTGDVDTISVTINGTYYLGIAGVVYPYLGVGLGYAESSFSGSARGNAGGFAYQGLAGVEVRFKYIGVNFGYKYLVADVRSKNSLGKTETNPMGGSGTLLGLTVHVPIR